MKVFVTGGSGFIGSYLLKALLSQGHDIMALKRKTSNLYRLEDMASQITWIDEEGEWDKQVIDFHPEILFNLAWQGVSAAERTSFDAQLINLRLQQQVLDIAKACGALKVAGIGSQAEYGAFQNKIDETYPAQPNSAYGAIKTASYHILRTFSEINGIDWFWFRVFSCFGPYESDRWLIPSLIKSILTKEEMDMTKGEQRLAYLYVGEVANAIASITQKDGTSGIYNICSDRAIPLRDLVTDIRDRIRPQFRLNFGALPYRYGQCMYMEGDTTKLRQQLYQLHTSDYSERLQQTIDYYINLYKNE